MAGPDGGIKLPPGITWKRRPGSDPRRRPELVVSQQLYDRSMGGDRVQKHIIADDYPDIAAAVAAAMDLMADMNARPKIYLEEKRSNVLARASSIARKKKPLEVGDVLDKAKKMYSASLHVAPRPAQQG